MSELEELRLRVAYLEGITERIWPTVRDAETRLFSLAGEASELRLRLAKVEVATCQG